jgi:predicted Zn-dependent peptidase
MFFNSSFDEKDVANERSVIFEEIDMYQDTPEDLCSERLASAVFKGFSLARPILGTKTTLRTMTGDALKRYKAVHYCADSIVVAYPRYRPEDIRYLQDVFSAMPKGAKQLQTALYADVTSSAKLSSRTHSPSPSGRGRLGDSRYALQLLCDIRAGMSSRLFQTVREGAGCAIRCIPTAQLYRHGTVLLYPAWERKRSARRSASSSMKSTVQGRGRDRASSKEPRTG